MILETCAPIPWIFMSFLAPPPADGGTSLGHPTRCRARDARRTGSGSVVHCEP
jgi:hypothetical protein